MFRKNSDPLTESIQKVMKENTLRRQLEAKLNEELGIYSKKQIPHEYHEEYDSALNTIISEQQDRLQHPAPRPVTDEVGITHDAPKQMDKIGLDKKMDKVGLDKKIRKITEPNAEPNADGKEPPINEITNDKILDALHKGNAKAKKHFDKAKSMGDDDPDANISRKKNKQVQRVADKAAPRFKKLPESLQEKMLQYLKNRKKKEVGSDEVDSDSEDEAHQKAQRDFDASKKKKLTETKQSLVSRAAQTLRNVRPAISTAIKAAGKILPASPAVQGIKSVSVNSEPPPATAQSLVQSRPVQPSPAAAKSSTQPTPPRVASTDYKDSDVGPDSLLSIRGRVLDADERGSRDVSRIPNRLQPMQTPKPPLSAAGTSGAQVADAQPPPAAAAQSPSPEPQTPAAKSFKSIRSGGSEDKPSEPSWIKDMGRGGALQNTSRVFGSDSGG